jgi:hypothetical protein
VDFLLVKSSCCFGSFFFLNPPAADFLILWITAPMKRRQRRQKKCFYCGKSFKSKAQQKDKQYTCGNPKCIAARRRKASKHWRDKNPGFQASHGMDDEYRGMFTSVNVFLVNRFNSY